MLDAQADKFTAEAAKEYMNPYQQAVTDIAKREALDDFDLIRQKFEKQAVGAGGMSGLGTRAAVQTGLLGETFAQNLADIQRDKYMGKDTSYFLFPGTNVVKTEKGENDNGVDLTDRVFTMIDQLNAVKETDFGKLRVGYDLHHQQGV